MIYMAEFLLSIYKVFLGTVAIVAVLAVAMLTIDWINDRRDRQ